MHSLRSDHTRSSGQGWLASLLGVLLLTGCGGNSTPAPQVSGDAPATESTTVGESVAAGDSATESSAEADKTPPSSESPAMELPVITFGGGQEATGQQPAGASAAGRKSAMVSEGEGEADVETIMAQLKELQILLGTWRGITQKEYGGFKAVDETEWVWDFQSQPEQPSLVMESEKSPFYREARLTFLPGKKLYQLTLKNAEGRESQFQGDFTVEISDDVGDDGKPQRTYKLELTEVTENPDGPLRLVFNQQNNNRYLLEVYRQRGNDQRFFRVDTVSTQREGTSLAMIDEGYGERTCIISGGLGTMSVTHKGQTFYVCCTGCKAAFEDDPERWIARAEEQAKSQATP